MAIEDDVREVLANLDEQDTPTQDAPSGTKQEEGRRVINVDKYNLPDGSSLYRLPNGEAVLLPSEATTTHQLDANSVESIAPTTPQEQAAPLTETPTIPLTDEAKEETEPSQETQPEPAPAGTRRRMKPSFMLVPLVLLFIFSAGAATYLYLLPLTASATVTITPEAKGLHTDATFTIATNPKAGQVQGRPLEAISFTKSKIVPATGHAHQDAMAATGVLTFYNTDSSPYTIPAGVTFSAPDGAIIVTDNPVTVQAAILPDVGSAIVNAHVLQTGSVGNIAARAIYTRCCGSEFLTATNTTAFSGGQDAKDYSFIQSSDIQNAASDLLGSLTPQATAALNKEARSGEILVTPLCSPRTISSLDAGTAAAEVTVSVTQQCYSVAYLTDSLNQAATSTLAHMRNLAAYEQVGTVQVTVNGSTYTNHTALLKVSLTGAWVYRFTKEQLTQLTHQIAGESQEQAKATIRKLDGVAQVSIHLQRLDFRNSLPTDPQRINVQFFYLVP